MMSTVLEVAAGIVIGGLTVLALVVVLIVAYGFVNRALRQHRIRQEYRARLAQHERDEAQRQRIRDERTAYLQDKLGGWVKLVELIEQNPEGRLQVTRGELDVWPLPTNTIDPYLNARWPGIGVWVEDEALDLGVIIRWQNRP